MLWRSGGVFRLDPGYKSGELLLVDRYGGFYAKYAEAFRRKTEELEDVLYGPMPPRIPYGSSWSMRYS